jgi:hypothetical protein
MRGHKRVSGRFLSFVHFLGVKHKLSLENIQICIQIISDATGILEMHIYKTFTKVIFIFQR